MVGLSDEQSLFQRWDFENPPINAYVKIKALMDTLFCSEVFFLENNVKVILISKLKSWRLRDLEIVTHKNKRIKLLNKSVVRQITQYEW